MCDGDSKAKNEIFEKKNFFDFLGKKSGDFSEVRNYTKSLSGSDGKQKVFFYLFFFIIF